MGLITQQNSNLQTPHRPLPLGQQLGGASVIGFQPLLPLSFILPIVLLYCLLAWLFYRRIHPTIPPRYSLLLIAGKMLSAGLLFLLLLNPFFRRHMNQNRDSHLIFLLDASRSMATRDCKKETRFEFIQHRLFAPNATFQQKLAATGWKTSFYLFSGKERRSVHPGQKIGLLPGNTDIDSILLQLLDQQGDDEKPAAVVLLSDGADNVGTSLMKAAGPYRRAGIPINCIGIGERSSRKDLSIHWETPPKKAEKGKAFPLTAVLTRNFSGPLDAAITFSNEGLVLKKETIHFLAEQRQLKRTFHPTAFLAGFAVYRIQVKSLPDEENQNNNHDLTGVQIHEPSRFRILYFSGKLNWEYRFLQRLADQQPQISLDAIIRTGEKNWFMNSLSGKKGQDKAVSGFPPQKKLNQYHAILFDFSGLPLLSEKEQLMLIKFAGERGGGILFMGRGESCPEKIRKLLPVTQLPDRPLSTTPSLLDLRPCRLWDSIRPPLPPSTVQRLRLPLNARLYPLSPEITKPGAITALAVRNSGWTALVAHHYGNGKVALLNLPGTWRWWMSRADGQDDYTQIWGRILAWLSSSSLQTMRIYPAFARLSLGQERTIRADLLNQDYQPENNARVTCRITPPDKKSQQVRLFPDPRVDGRYTAVFIGRKSGEYHLSFSAKLPGANGKTRTKDADYLVSDLSIESRPAPMAEAQLRNLARATGGTFSASPNIPAPKNLALQHAQNRKETRVFWLNLGLFLLLGLLILSFEWYLRRRIGLR